MNNVQEVRFFITHCLTCVSYIRLRHFKEPTIYIWIYTGFLFSLGPPNLSTKKKPSIQPITAAVSVNRVYKEGCDWLLGSIVGKKRDLGILDPMIFPGKIRKNTPKIRKKILKSRKNTPKIWKNA